MGRYSITKKDFNEISEVFENVLKSERELSYMTRKR